jgi:hypothetical protein
MLVDDFHRRAQVWGAGFNVSEFQDFNVTGKSYRKEQVSRVKSFKASGSVRCFAQVFLSTKKEIARQGERS